MEDADNLGNKEKKYDYSSLDLTKDIYQWTLHKTKDFLLKDIDINDSIYSENFG